MNQLTTTQTSRRLATIQTVKVVEPIPNKDRIGLASFEGCCGFQVIVNKADVVPGTVCVYFECDSVLPPKPEFEFLRQRCWSESVGGHRIRCMKMAGVFSEGLALPISALGGLPEHLSVDGADVTEFLGVSKYDPEAAEEAKQREAVKRGTIMTFLMGFWWFRKIYFALFPQPAKMLFPSFVAKTDETRVQNLLHLFEDNGWKGKTVSVTEKMNGQSATFFMKRTKILNIFTKYGYGVCSRNLRLERNNSKYWQVSDLLNMEHKMRIAVHDMKCDIAVQLESCGPGIQGNQYGFETLRPFVFNVYNITRKRYLDFEEMVAFCTKYELPMVPILDVRKFDWVDVVEIVKYSEGYSVFGHKVQREGVVIRPIVNEGPTKGMSNMASFKVISPTFLLKCHD
jgi:hypothetical protein